MTPENEQNRNPVSGRTALPSDDSVTMENKDHSERKDTPNGNTAESIARLVLRPEIRGAATIRSFSKSFGDIDLTGLAHGLTEQIKEVNNGDLRGAEAMLIGQAHTLNAIFNDLAIRAINADWMNNLETYLRLALKAQSQSRATLETVAMIKNPSQVAFVRQANIGFNQQVNNGTGHAGKSSRARGNENLENEQLEAIPNERLDTGAPCQTVSADPTLETVGKIDRTANSGG